MERLVESCKTNNNSASIELVFSNNTNASGLSFAKNNNIKPLQLIIEFLKKEKILIMN